MIHKSIMVCDIGCHTLSDITCPTVFSEASTVRVPKVTGPSGRVSRRHSLVHMKKHLCSVSVNSQCSLLDVPLVYFMYGFVPEFVRLLGCQAGQESFSTGLKTIMIWEDSYPTGHSQEGSVKLIVSQ